LARRDALLEGAGPFGAAEIDGFWVMSSFRLLAKTGFVLFLVLPLTINIHAEAHYPAGTDVSSYVGDLAGVNNNAAYNSFRLYELWVEKGFKVGPFVGLLKAGLLSADQEFDLIDAASFFY